MGSSNARRYRIMLVDDDHDVLDVLTETLESEGYVCRTALTARQALKMLNKENFDLLITDVRLPDLSGLELLETLRKNQPGLPTIVITGYASIESTKKAMRLGAVDYLPKPFGAQTVLSAVGRALDPSRPSTMGRYGEDIIYRSEAMERVMDLVQRVSNTSSTVLLIGESGTGKELLARGIHALSRRSGQQFVSVNSGALPENLLESELFGHKKGAFTGAVTTTLGRFHVADAGTLFLDEIGNMSPAMQVKLLRVLQEGEFSPVGSNEVVKVDVRLIAATNMNLEKIVSEGSFREDLYYRLNVIDINVPPLRYRREDIIPLAEHYLRRFSSGTESGIMSLAPDAVSALMSYDWPGNVRELQNTIERAAVLADGDVIYSNNLPSRMLSKTSDSTLPQTEDLVVDLPKAIEALERYYIHQALQSSQGSKAAAARKLGLKRTTLLAKMKRLGVPNDTGKKD
ncbi:response regulator [Candidatus Fermentibacteria bacterium]|nr:response regulator [Candidatus Fermentibacteria bacterium]